MRCVTWEPEISGRDGAERPHRARQRNGSRRAGAGPARGRARDARGRPPAPQEAAERPPEAPPGVPRSPPLPARPRVPGRHVVHQKKPSSSVCSTPQRSVCVRWPSPLHRATTATMPQTGVVGLVMLGALRPVVLGRRSRSCRISSSGSDRPDYRPPSPSLGPSFDEIIIVVIMSSPRTPCGDRVRNIPPPRVRHGRWCKHIQPLSPCSPHTASTSSRQATNRRPRP